MSRLNLKTDFKDGDKLFGIELNNNFKVIEEGYDGTTKEYEDIVADVKARKWQGESNESVAYFKGTTSEVNARQTIKGQVLYDISTGETFLDVSDSVRINTGSGNVVEISETEPENDATKLWIDDQLVSGVMTEVVDSMENPSSNMAPSVNAVKDYVDFKLLNTVTGRVSIQLPENYNEILIITTHHQGSYDQTFSTHLTKNDITNKQYIYTGFYYSATEYATCNWYINNNTIVLNTLNINGSNYHTVGETNIYIK